MASINIRDSLFILSLLQDGESFSVDSIASEYKIPKLKLKSAIKFLEDSELISYSSGKLKRNCAIIN